MNTTQKVGLACGFGALVGASIALQFQLLSWWLGLLIGAVTTGIVSYLSYEFKEVIKAIPKAWNAVVNWRPNKAAYKYKFITISAYTVGTFSFIALFVFIVNNGIVFIAALFGVLRGSLMEAFSDGVMIAFILGTALSAFILVISLTNMGINTYYESMEKQKIDDNLKDAKWILIYLNPLSIIYTGLYCLSCVIWKHRVKIARFLLKVLIFPFTLLNILRKFAWTLFKLIHSDIRLLCLVDGIFGMIIGYYLQNPLIGAIFGAAFGMLNYRVVSLWWLKLKPKHS